MNELIEELVRRYCPNGEPNLSRNQFTKAIQIACEAQRNACLRESDKFKTSLDMKIRDSEREAILNAEVSKEDYENVSN